MTRPSSPLTRAIPTAALLPRSPHAPACSFPSPTAALLGPLPPTAPLHLALNHLLLTDDAARFISVASPYERVLVITGHADELRTELEEEDEDWLRLNGGKYGVLDRLKRVEMRWAHYLCSC